MLNHFLVTRFNVKVKNWNWTKNGQLPLTNEWLTYRFKLFENYCLPSVKNQTNQNFRWCIFFDINTPIFFKNKIINIANDYPIIKIFFLDSNDELLCDLKSFIQKNTSRNTEFIITTRLDNDDLLHKEFISTVQKLFQPIHNLIIDLRSGYQVSIENGNIEIRDYENSFNPFISLIEKSQELKTVMSRMHKDWENIGTNVIYKTKRLWIELTHKNNLINSRNLSLVHSAKFDPNDFAIKGFEIINEPNKRNEDSGYFERLLSRIIIKLKFFFG
jgi:hypothetical protein